MIFNSNKIHINEDNVDDVIKSNINSTSSEDVNFKIGTPRVKRDNNENDDADFSMDGINNSDDNDNNDNSNNTDEDNSDEDNTKDNDASDDNTDNNENDDADFSMDSSDDDFSSNEDNSSDPGTSEDSSDNAESEESDLVQKEKDLFKNLTDEQIKIKKYELIVSINTLYSSCDDILYRLNNVVKSISTMRTIEFLIKKLNELRDNISFYIINTFNTKSYIENYIYYQNCLLIFNDISKILNEITPKLGKNNSK